MQLAASPYSRQRGKEPRMTETTETAPASGASTPSGRKGGLNAMLLPELKQLAGGLGIKATGMRKGELIEAIKSAQSGSQAGTQASSQSGGSQSGGSQGRSRTTAPGKAQGSAPAGEE